MNIYKKMKEAGVEISNHCSDMYVPVNKTTTGLLADYEFRRSVTTFTSNIDGELTYDIPFAYDPFFPAGLT